MNKNVSKFQQFQAPGVATDQTLVERPEESSESFRQRFLINHFLMR